MSLKDPVFIVGTGRCGSTLFHDILADHPDFSWLSSILDKYPGKPQRNRMVNSGSQLPGLGSWVKRFYHPAEPYRFWERYCKGFATPYRDLVAGDVIPAVVPRIQKQLEYATCANQRLLVKITGWPRIGYLKEIFPDARFIHVVRDGRAVVNSVLAAPYFEGWSGPHNWTRGAMDERQREVWERSGESFVVLAGIGWQNRMRAFSNAKNDLSSEEYHEIRYEQLCENPSAALADSLEFAGASREKTEAFLKIAVQRSIGSSNNKWKSDLSECQREFLQEILNPTLNEYGYL